jgi:hypothetical protein
MNWDTGLSFYLNELCDSKKITKIQRKQINQHNIESIFGFGEKFRYEHVFENREIEIMVIEDDHYMDVESEDHFMDVE